MRQNRKMLAVAISLAAIATLLLTACQPQTVIQTVEVTKEVQVVQTQVVQQTVEVQSTVIATQQVNTSFTTPHPILGDPKVRQAIAYCSNRPELIASVYPWLPADQQGKLLMDTEIPSISWAAYDGPEIVKYPFDAKKGGDLLDQAGWKLGDGATYRANDNGQTLILKFTTTTASFRKTWSAVWINQMKACGIQILPLYAPASWWFGSTTGLRHRDFELGAYAWVGESDPKGITLYSCAQIPLPTNGWVGQNYMGWCNKTASDAINAANNTLVKDERKAAYKTFQIEFAKDMVSLPLFQRAEGNAATLNLQNFKPTPTDYYMWNADEWSLKDGSDKLVLAFSQEPDTMYTLVSSSAVQAEVARLVYGKAFNQVDYDYQPAQADLATVESGAAVQSVVDVKEGDPVVDASGVPTDADGNLLTLKDGLTVKNSDGQDVAWKKGDPLKMKQLVVKYTWAKGLTWSDGQPVVKADFELGYKNDCDPKSGAQDYTTCQSIQKVDFISDTEYDVTYKPGYANSLYFLAPIGYYPSHQVLSDGRKLADVPTTEWSTLKEVAETPLGAGPYVLTSWDKGQKLELDANPHYYKGADTLKIKHITIQIIQDTQQAVAQLLTGDVDVVGSETLGAGPEVDTVLKNQKKLQVLIEPSATWEHIDMNLFVP